MKLKLKNNRKKKINENKSWFSDNIKIIQPLARLTKKKLISY